MDLSYTIRPEAREEFENEISNQIISLVKKESSNEFIQIFGEMCKEKGKIKKTDKLRKYTKQFVENMSMEAKMKYITKPDSDWEFEYKMINHNDYSRFDPENYIYDPVKQELMEIYGPRKNISKMDKYILKMPTNEDIFKLWKKKRLETQDLLNACCISLKRKGLYRDVIEKIFKKTKLD